VPVLGVNVGQLGYLTEVEPSDMHDALERFFGGRYHVEPRMTLEIEVDGTPRMALNEAVLEKTASGHTVRLAMSINDGPFLTTQADGLIVSTPTGSTAYNFSARGPIVSPRLRGLVVTPVSPHTLFDRSLVLDEDEWVRLEVLEGRPAALVVDGRGLGTLQPGATVVCRAGRHDARFVTFAGRDFHQILKAKFSLADR
jgi:NAD+ kinase